jgi:hypothetical protein
VPLHMSLQVKNELFCKFLLLKIELIFVIFV